MNVTTSLPLGIGSLMLVVLSSSSISTAAAPQVPDTNQRLASLESSVTEHEQKLSTLKSENDRLVKSLQALETQLKEFMNPTRNKESERTFKELTHVVAAQAREMKDQQGRLDQLTRLGEAVTGAAREFGASAERSRKGGFESAGPNPVAKHELLKGIEDFAQSIDKAWKALKNPKEETKN